MERMKVQAPTVRQHRKQEGLEAAGDDVGGPVGNVGGPVGKPCDGAGGDGGGAGGG